MALSAVEKNEGWDGNGEGSERHAGPFSIERDQESIHQQECPFSKDQVHGEPTLVQLATAYFPTTS